MPNFATGLIGQGGLVAQAHVSSAEKGAPNTKCRVGQVDAARGPEVRESNRAQRKNCAYGVFKSGKRRKRVEGRCRAFPRSMHRERHAHPV